MLQLLIISDSHLFESREIDLYGVNPFNSLEYVVERITYDEVPYDLIVVAGDLSEDGSTESYHHVNDLFHGLPVTTIWMKGNHDNFSNIPHELHAKYVQSEVHKDPWHFIFLDTTIDGKDEGELSQSELIRLELFLDTYSEKHILIFMHHQPIDVGSEFIDLLGLKNRNIFWELIAPYSNIRGIVFGHVHQAYDNTRNGIRLISVPSTSIQFKPFSKDLDFDDLAYGYRTISLDVDGTFQTKIKMWTS